MLAENFFAAARRQGAPEAITTAGIFGKPKLARLFSSRREVAAPAYDADYLWTPCEDPGDDTPYCRQVPINPATQYAATDGIVMDEVLRTVREGVEADGAVKRPNLTFVNFPQIDSAGHATGTGAAYDAAIAQADGELRRFVDQQRELGLWERTVLFVVSDHSMDSTAHQDLAGAALPRRGDPGLGLPDRAERQRGHGLPEPTAGGRTRRRRWRSCAPPRWRPSLPGMGQTQVDEALYRRAEPRRRRGRAHARRGAPGLADRRRAHRRPVRHPHGGRRVLRSGEPAARQPRRAADERQHVRGDRRRGARAPAVARRRRSTPATTTRCATRARPRTWTSRRRRWRCSGARRPWTARGAC